VVAGAGNKRPDQDLSVFCPALSDNAIAVGGHVTECHHKVREEQKHSLEPNRDIKPPGTYWTDWRPDDIEGEDVDVNDCYCGHMGCLGESNYETRESGRYLISGDKNIDSLVDEQCLKYRYQKVWSGNVEPCNEKPDVTAPVHLPAKTEGTRALLTGTSYATPWVAGSIADILSFFYSEGRHPDPVSIRRAVTDSSEELDEGELGKYNANNTMNSIADRCDLEVELS
jgi:hypothetical protein